MVESYHCVIAQLITSRFMLLVCTYAGTITVLSPPRLGLKLTPLAVYILVSCEKPLGINEGKVCSDQRVSSHLQMRRC